MEIFYAILGIMMFGLWAWSAVIIGRKLKATRLENVVVSVSAVLLALFIIGSL